MSEIADFLRVRYVAQRECEMGQRRSIPSAFDDHEVEVRYERDMPAEVLVDGHPYPADKYLDMATEPAPDPDVIADLDAKLALIDEHPDVNDGSCGTCVDAQWGYPTHGGSSPAAHPCRTLRLLAQPFTGHSDHKGEEWAP